MLPNKWDMYLHGKMIYNYVLVKQNHEWNNEIKEAHRLLPIRACSNKDWNIPPQTLHFL